LSDSRVKVASLQTKLSNARIKKINPHEITSNAKVVLKSSATRLSNTRVKVTSSQTRLSDSRIKTTTPVIRLSNTRIKSTSSQTRLSDATIGSIFYILDVSTDPISVGLGNNTNLRCDFFDNDDFGIGSYACHFWVREPDNTTTHGIYLGSITQSTGGSYYAENLLTINPAWNIGSYDVRAKVFKG
jgi:hypothetical protein